MSNQAATWHYFQYLQSWNSDKLRTMLLRHQANQKLIQEFVHNHNKFRRFMNYAGELYFGADAYLGLGPSKRAQVLY